MWRDVLTAILVIGGLLMLTLAVLGVVKMPDVYTRLHVASKAAVLGLLPFLLAAALVGERATITRDPDRPLPGVNHAGRGPCHRAGRLSNRRGDADTGGIRRGGSPRHVRATGRSHQGLTGAWREHRRKGELICRRVNPC